jgi:hypothetical protein
VFVAVARGGLCRLGLSFMVEFLLNWYIYIFAICGFVELVNFG